MIESKRCPLSEEERERYCMCDTCLFVKSCLEEMDQEMQTFEEQREITEKETKNGKRRG